MKLAGKVALVTGGSRGIGRAICEGLAQEGADIVINCYRPADAAVGRELAAEEVAAAVQALGRKALVVEADVSSEEQVERMVSQALDHFGHIDVLVNNAAIILRKPIVETTAQEWRRVFAVNIDGYFYCTRAVARHMIQRGKGGHIINISSVNAVLAIPQRACYAATKGAIEAFTRVCGLELAPYGIQVNAVAPGVTDTEINLEFLTPETRRFLEARLPIGRIAKPEEIAATVVAVACGAVPYMVGQVIRVDGGWSNCEFDYGRFQLKE